MDPADNLRIARTGRTTRIAAMIRLINRGMTRRFPARKPRQAALAVSEAFDRGMILKSRVRLIERCSKNGVLSMPGQRHVMLTPEPATSDASADENDLT